MKKSVTALLTLIAASSAHASIIYMFDSVTPIGGGSFDWEYTAQLSADQKIDTTLSPAYAVVYDFLGVTGATTSDVVAGLTLDTFLEDTTSPQPFDQDVPDSPTIPNVVTTMTGSFEAEELTDLYTIDIISTAGPDLEKSVFQSAQALKDAPGDPANNTVTGNTAQIIGPSIVPEPATLLIMGIGLIVLGSRRKRA